MKRQHPRYVVDEKGTQVRPHRIYDTHTGKTIIYTADPLIATRMAEEYEKQWLRSTFFRRNLKRLVRAIRSLFNRKERPRPVAAPTIREQRVARVEELCEQGRAKLAAIRHPAS